MWHEARRQEKILKNTMIDQSKRAERKRRYYDHVRKDPAQFMQIHGRKSHIYTDLSIVKAAESSNILRPWQGDPSITIDRFDARAHLTKIDLLEEDEADIKISKKDEKIVDEKEEIVCDFERNRILVINSYKGVTEKNYLKKIAEREFYTEDKESNKKYELEKKKKSADKKSTIGFSYEDSEVVKGESRAKPLSDDELEEENAEFDDLEVDVDTQKINAEAQRVLNKSGEEYGVKRSLFCALLRADQQAKKDEAQLKMIERAKAQLSGRDSKQERMILRQQRLAIVGKANVRHGATVSLLDFINDSNKKSKYDEMMHDSDDNHSDKDDRKSRKEKTEFITTFGGAEDGESEEETQKLTSGPELPSAQYRKILELSKKRNQEDKVDWGEMKPRNEKNRSRSRSVSRSPIRRRRTRSPPNRSRSRSRDRNYRRRRSSRSRSRSKDRKRRSRSRDRNIRRRSSSRSRGYNSRRRSPSRSRSRDRRRSRKNRSPDRKMFGRAKKTPSRSPSSSSSSSVASPRRNSDKVGETSSKKRAVSDGSDTDEREDDVKMVEIRSSMSESEKERCEIENRKRRIKLTKKMVKEKRKTNDGSSDDEDERRKVEVARKLKEKMNEALKKNRDKLAKEQREKQKEAEIEQRVREELNYIEEMERQEREYSRRKAEREDRRKIGSPTRDKDSKPGK